MAKRKTVSYSKHLALLYGVRPDTIRRWKQQGRLEYKLMQRALEVRQKAENLAKWKGQQK